MPLRAFIDSDHIAIDQLVVDWIRIVLMPLRAFIDSDLQYASGKRRRYDCRLNALTGIY